jgi:hypothetical protein
MHLLCISEKLPPNLGPRGGACERTLQLGDLIVQVWAGLRPAMAATA